MLFVFVFIALPVFSQKLGKVVGVVKDALTNETIPSAVVVWGDKKDQGLVTEIDGTFKLEMPYGNQKLYFSAVGYVEQTVDVIVGNREANVEIQLVLQNQKELVIVTDLAVGRKVPVAYSNIDMKRIDEELSGREMPLWPTQRQELMQQDREEETGMRA